MTDALIGVGAFVWIACGVLDYGLTVAYYQRKYAIIASESETADRLLALFLGLLGPFGLFATLVVCRPLRGWML